ncbi:MAG: beta-hydroxyacyl-ACP dehydratase [Spirochaetales bacterium]|nr:beta-hydroxyacyl-ACP dehydratase [Spirochaetales bacterium]
MSDNYLYDNFHNKMQLLDKKYPYLLIDRIISVNRETGAITGQKYVSSLESFFQGHFPGNPVFPGVLLIMACSQLLDYMFIDKQIKFAGMKRIRFISQVVPGDVITFKIILYNESENIKTFDCSGEVEGEEVFKGKLLVSFQQG